MWQCLPVLDPQARLYRMPSWRWLVVGGYAAGLFALSSAPVSRRLVAAENRLVRRRRALPRWLPSDKVFHALVFGLGAVLLCRALHDQTQHAPHGRSPSTASWPRSATASPMNSTRPACLSGPQRLLMSSPMGWVPRWPHGDGCMVLAISDNPTLSEMSRRKVAIGKVCPVAVDARQC